MRSLEVAGSPCVAWRRRGASKDALRRRDRQLHERKEEDRGNSLRTNQARTPPFSQCENQAPGSCEGIISEAE